MTVFQETEGIVKVTVLDLMPVVLQTAPIAASTLTPLQVHPNRQHLFYTIHSYHSELLMVHFHV